MLGHHLAKDRPAARTLWQRGRCRASWAPGESRGLAHGQPPPPPEAHAVQGSPGTAAAAPLGRTPTPTRRSAAPPPRGGAPSARSQGLGNCRETHQRGPRGCRARAHLQRWTPQCAQPLRATALGQLSPTPPPPASNPPELPTLGLQRERLAQQGPQGGRGRSSWGPQGQGEGALHRDGHQGLGAPRGHSLGPDRMALGGLCAQAGRGEGRA